MFVRRGCLTTVTSKENMSEFIKTCAEHPIVMVVLIVSLVVILALFFDGLTQVIHGWNPYTKSDHPEERG